MDLDSQPQATSPTLSETRYRTLFNAIDEGFCIIEYLDGPHGPLSDYVHVEANPAFARHTGLSGIVGRRVRDVVPREADVWIARYRPVLETGVPIRFEQDLVATGRRLELAAFRIEPPELRQVAVLFTDVTARHEAELQLRRYAEEMRENDQRKSEFVAMLAHELRGPLAPIRNMVEIMKRAPDDLQIAHLARDTIERQHASLHRLVDDLLDLNRITRDRLELREESVELRAVIDQALETVRPIAHAAKHRIEVELPAQPIRLHADPVRLAQVFGNLLHNACKYTEPGGLIRVTAERDAGDVVVRVRDSGVGLPEDKLEAVFEMFTQVDRTLERSRGGLGIGLTLVKRLVELHGGTVTALSDGPGKGSEFVVRLPAMARDAVSTPAPAPAAQPPLTGRRILVVDDNPDAASSLAMLLDLTGNTTRTVNDGMRAVEEAAAYRPQIILLDLGLPGMSGYDVCRAIRGAPWSKGVVIVAVSGWGQEEDRRKSGQAGFDAHLVKPVEFGALTALLSSLGQAGPESPAR